MHTETVDRYDYDGVRACPFCDGSGLWIFEEGNCPHYVTAFEAGEWDPDLIPPVFCDGFRFFRRALLRALQKNGGVISKRKPGTVRHPQIEALFCADPKRARRLRRKFRIPPLPGAICETCGNESAVRRGSEWCCALCGGYAKFKTEPEITRMQADGLERPPKADGFQRIGSFGNESLTRCGVPLYPRKKPK